METDREPTAAALSDADAAAVRAVHDRFSAALLRQDFDAIAALYTEGAVLLPPQEPAVHGREAIRRWTAAVPKVTRIVLNVDDLDGRGDLAYMRGSFAMTLEPEGGPAVSVAGKYVEILEKQRDGSWRFAVDIFNSDTP
jgi:uncharacterized protein (TIGR02246 family)